MKYTTSYRLKQIMKERNLRQIDILAKCEAYCETFDVKLAKNDLSQYISGKTIPRQDKLTILGLALDVNEVWLMGYDVPADINTFDNNDTNESENNKGIILSQEEEELLINYRMLNEYGQEKLLENSQELTELTKYKKRDINELIPEQKQA